MSLEIDDIENNKFLSRDCLLAKDKNEFYKHLELFSGDMEKTREFAKENKLKPKHIAILENGNARVQLSGVDKNSVFYNLSGSDNVVVITTQYYKQNPIMIKGSRCRSGGYSCRYSIRYRLPLAITIINQKKFDQIIKYSDQNVRF